MRAPLLVPVLWFGAFAGAQPAAPQATIASPAIAALTDAVRRHVPSAESEFWTRVQRDGAPLVERMPGDTANVLFTFVWRGDSATKHVALLNAAVASQVPSEALLARVPGTNVWYRSYPARADARVVYELSPNDNLVPWDRVTDWGARTATFRRDPFNTRVFQAAIVGRSQSYAEGPRAPKEEWIAERAGVPKGIVAETTFTSKLLGSERRVWIYTPAGYDTLARAGRLPLLLTFDGGEYVSSVPVPTILDNLIAARRIGPMIGVFVATPPPQRDAELGMNERFAEFLATELVPWLRTRYAVADSPARNVVAGSSLGGLAAAFVAHRHPELFGNVLSQSGAFMFGPPIDPRPERFAREVATAPRRDIAFYLEAGAYETMRLESGVDLLTSNRHLRDALRAKGYRVTYDEFAGGHSDLNWRSGFARGLLALSPP
jgi:enterochelin esterase-like enzyme